MKYPDLLSTALIILLLTGCETITENGGSGADEFFDDAEPVSFQTVEKGSYGNYDVEARNFVIRDRGVFRSFWEELYGNRQPMPSVPQLDFTKHVIAVTVMGTRPSGGYSTEIAEVASGFDRLGIRIRSHIPGENCGVTGALTNPYHIVKIEHTDLRVMFFEEESTLDCSQ